MTHALYQVRQCTNTTCRLRFPMPMGGPPGEHCPRCGTPTQVVMDVAAPDPITPTATAHTSWPIEALLDNIRSLFNVGSIFRSSDGAGLRHLHLCGITPTPDNPKLIKTALGAEQAVGWSYHTNSLDAVAQARAAGYAIWALEEHPQAESLFTVAPIAQPLLLVVGSEVIGVDPAILAACDQIVAIPMQGIKRSLNVATAFGVAAVILSERWASARSNGQ